MVKKLRKAWWYSFSVVSILFISSLVIYGLDIRKTENLGTYNKSRALGDLLKNDTKRFYYYKIDNKYAYRINTNPLPGENNIAIVTYQINYFPICLFCGFYTDDLEREDKPINSSIDINTIVSKHEELSFMGPDDEDCMIAFLALSLCYFILLIWGLIAYFRRS